MMVSAINPINLMRNYDVSFANFFFLGEIAFYPPMVWPVLTVLTRGLLKLMVGMLELQFLFPFFFFKRERESHS